MLLQCVLFCILSTFATGANPENTAIKSGTVWYDTAGHELHAHGGGFWFDQASSKYYWIGTTQKQGGAWLSEGINCYSSVDLGNWTFEGRIFDNTSIKGEGSGPFRIERPKVLFNKKTNKFVMWFHLDSSGFGLRKVGVAVSSTIAGTYQWVSGFLPDGQASYDMTLYQEDDGSAYLCRSVGNQYAGISQLTDDYLNTKGITSRGPDIEGQAIWKMNGRYYLLGSHLTSWAANQAVLSISDGAQLNGATWTILPVITTSSTTWESQSTYVLPYMHPDGKMLYIFMGDRWAYPDVGKASYVWLPFVIKSATEISLPWEASWVIRDY